MKMRFRMRLHMFEDFMHVVACRKGGARATQYDEADGAGLPRERVDMVVKRLEHIFGQGIQLLRAVEPQRRRAAVIFPAHQIVHSEDLPCDSTIRRRATGTGLPCPKSDWPGPAPKPAPPAGRIAPHSALLPN